MAKFNVVDKRAARGASPITTEHTPTGVTHEGAPGYAHDVKSELFLLAVANMVGEDTFYENAANRDDRYTGLVRHVAVTDPDWMARFLTWLRGDANMRSASLVAAVEAAHALLAAGQPGARQMVASVLQRADEPGEALAYWTGRYGRAVPKPVKRGVADAARRLYGEYALLKYDTASHGFRFADVIDLTHPSPVNDAQGQLFRYALDRRHNHAPDFNQLVELKMVLANTALRHSVARGLGQLLFDPAALKAAGMTWEDALSLAGTFVLPTVDRAKLWTALIPTMGYMALLRNLRNFDQADLPDQVADQVIARLTDTDQVARSRQFPYRFLAAYEAAPSVRWSRALDKALALSLRNLPDLPGRTLVLIDTSASMRGSLSERSKMSPAKVAAVFGVALAYRCGADLFGFADGQFRHEVRKGATVIREVDNFVGRTGEVGHGTEIAAAIRATYARHDRVFLISDMQTMDRNTGSALPAGVPLYGFNLGGYKHTAYRAGSPNRHEFGGLTDATFRMVPLIEAGQKAAWPF